MFCCTSQLKNRKNCKQILCLTPVGSQMYRGFKFGRFPFTKRFRKFRLGCKWNTWGVFHLPKNSGNSGWDVNGTREWNTTFRFVPLENFRKKWNFWKGSPVFPVENFPMENLCSIYRISRLYHQFHTFCGLFKRPGFPGLPRVSKKWRKLVANKLQGYYECSACHVLAPDHENVLQHECASFKSGR